MGVVQSAVRPAGEGWHAPVPLSAAGGRSFAADVAIDPWGQAAAVWMDFANKVIQAAVRPAGADRWRAPKDISQRGRGGGGPDVAFDARGNATAVWTTIFGTLQSATRPAGGDWQRAVTIAHGDGEITDAHVGLDARGGAVAAWLQSGGESVHGAVRSAGGRWQAPTVISPDTPAPEASGAQLSLAVDPQGRAVAVFGRAAGDTAYVAQAAAYGPRSTTRRSGTSTMTRPPVP
jgi:hypothetical protein